MNKSLLNYGLLFCIVTLLTLHFISAGSWTFSDKTSFLNNSNGISIEQNSIEENQDYIELTERSETFNYLWVANSGESTISKIDTQTSKEIARYATGPLYPTSGENPSRTAVDKDGNVWVGNRLGNHDVVKIAGYNESCIDKNNDGIITTSKDVNNNGQIDASEILPWGTDECVLLSKNYWPGLDATTEVGPRSLAMDANNYLWVGIWNSTKYYKIDSNGTLIAELPPLASSNAYGAAAGKDNILWSNDVYLGLTKINVISNSRITTYPISSFGCAPGHCFYAIAADKNNNVWLTNWMNGTLQKFNANTGTITTYNLPGAGISASIRGVTVSHDNYIWVTNYFNGEVIKMNSAGNVMCHVNTSAGYNSLAGIAEDGEGNIWAIGGWGSLISDSVWKINPINCQIIKRVPVGKSPYTYSDATGNLVKQFIKEGYWEVTIGKSDYGPIINWSNISWTETTAGLDSFVNVTINFFDEGGESYFHSSTTTNQLNNYNYVLTDYTSRSIDIKFLIKKDNLDISPILDNIIISYSNYINGTGVISDNCSGSLPINASWNDGGWDGKFNRTWDQQEAEYLPRITNTIYNETVDETIGRCNFKCNKNYVWNSSSGTCDFITNIIYKTCQEIPFNTCNSTSNVTLLIAKNTLEENGKNCGTEYIGANSCNYFDYCFCTWENEGCTAKKTVSLKNTCGSTFPGEVGSCLFYNDLAQQGNCSSSRENIVVELKYIKTGNITCNNKTVIIPCTASQGLSFISNLGIIIAVIIIMIVYIIKIKKLKRAHSKKKINS
jgi:hypothetical protein